MSYFIPKSIFSRFFPDVIPATNRLVQVPQDILLLIIPLLNEKELNNLCKSDKILKEKLCNNPDSSLWMDLFRQHFSTDIDINDIINRRTPKSLFGTTVKSYFFETKDFLENRSPFDTFLIAGQFGYDRILENVLEVNPSLANTEIFNSANMLLVTLNQGIYMNTINILLRNGADPNSTDVYGETPLLLAVSKCNIDLVLLLLKYGADVNKPGKDGQTPLKRIINFPKYMDNYYSSSCKNDLINLLIESGAV